MLSSIWTRRVVPLPAFNLPVMLGLIWFPNIIGGAPKKRLLHLHARSVPEELNWGTRRALIGHAPD